MATRINFRKIFGHSRGFTSKKKNGSFFSLPLKPVTEVHSSSFLVLVYATRYLQVPQSLGNRNSFLIAHVHKHEVIISINYRRNHSAEETSVVYVSLPFFMGHCRITCLPSGFPRQCGKLYSVSKSLATFSHSSCAFRICSKTYAKFLYFSFNFLFYDKRAVTISLFKWNNTK